MLKPKHFIAVTTETLNDKLVLINTSCGTSLLNENGITFDVAIEFLFNLIRERRDDRITVFVCYAASRDNEFIFSTMPRYLKDKLFKAPNVKQRIYEIQNENEGLETIIYTKKNNKPEYQQATFERGVNRLALDDLTEVEHNGYDIKLANGKSLIIRHNGKVITIYDIFGFFKPKPLRGVVKQWLGPDLVWLDRRELDKQPFTELEKIKIKSTLEVAAVSKLAAKLDQELKSEGINLSRYHGATAISSYWLGKLKAKDEFHNYRFKRQLSPELYKAIRQANYGGRAEQFKIGTIENVYVYDINSAYAFACSYLPKCLRKPNFVQKYTQSPFSVWFVDYDFSKCPNQYLGYLPNRDFSNATRYKLKGRGYFWQPEVRFVLDNFPDCVEVKGGFVLDYERAEFAKGIETLYQLRLELQRRGNPLEKVFKLALASIYGKFCQHNGRGHFYNLMYAGFITSLTRMQLLEATKGHENQTISFQTDAIHTTADDLPVLCDDSLGDYKRHFYSRITYLDNGVYRCFDKDHNVVKEKTRGFRSFEFEQALKQIKDQQTYTALNEFFIGHNLHSQNMFSGAPYLSHHAVSKDMAPVTNDKSAMRLFEVLDIDLTKEYFDSKPLRTFSGLESGVYRQNDYKALIVDTIEAGRV